MQKRNGSFLPLLVAAGLFLSGVTVFPVAPALAAEMNTSAVQLSRDAAVAKARDMFALAESDWSVRSVALYQKGAGEWQKEATVPSWSMWFESTKGSGTLLATLDANTGQLLAMTRPSTAEAKEFTLDQQFENGEAFLKRYAPQVLPELARNASTGWQTPTGTMRLNWDRKTRDGAYVINDRIWMEVSPGGEVTQFHLNWTDVELPEVESKLTVEQVKDLFAKTLEMQLRYERRYDSQGKSEYTVVYKPLYRSTSGNPTGYAEHEYLPLFDARSGEYLDLQGRPVAEPNLTRTPPFQPNGPVAPRERATALTEQEVFDLVEKNGLIREGYIPHSTQYTEKDGHKIWQLRYLHHQSNNLDDDISLSVDASTGELAHLYDFGDPPVNGLPAMSDADVKAKAVELVTGLFPNRLGLLGLTDGPLEFENGNEQRVVRFPQLHNGLATDGGVQLYFDAAGQLLRVQTDFLNGEELTAYPSAQGVITPERAESILLDQIPLRLSWLIVHKDSGETETVPVYAPKRASYLDFVLNAHTGKPFLENEREASKPKPSMPTDIVGHWAEEVLTRYAKLGHLNVSAEGKAHPDQAISRAELIRLAVDRTVAYVPNEKTEPTFPDISQDHPQFVQIEEAYRKGWIRKSDAFRPTDAISREEAATIFARMAGYKRLSQDHSIFKLPYADSQEISEWAQGSVAIGYSFGVMRGANNQFRPKANITLAEVVTILERIPGMDDNIGIYPW
ncbi:S-layer homology domain-containing protein [Tumebacillus sp. DT12]|uniref:S-layer homology domain-containing protein n=1 Tax=Tumebacillus lacus TaxID=2995335 RepID=A0ABT3X1D5_9BACL|nr:S-layer homology domain-containing protein [Tumebacillus lacus]MCX7570705.1 S-layer homology domain-containing protein [Tumebacillus lacus]